MRLAIVVPGEGGFDDAAFRHMPGAVPPVEGEVLARAADPVAVDHVVPPQLPGQRLGVGVEQQFVRVEAMSGGRVIRPVHAIAVELVGPRLRQIAVPHLVRVFRKRDARLLGLPGPVEQAQLDFFGMRREQREIDALAVPARAERIRQPGPHLRRGHSECPCGAASRADDHGSAVKINTPSGGNCRRSE